eukprot:COSAG02_NODE_2016_length_10101_cov_10.944011_5_plen_72_part_00
MPVHELQVLLLAGSSAGAGTVGLRTHLAYLVSTRLGSVSVSCRRAHADAATTHTSEGGRRLSLIVIHPDLP